MTAPTRQPATRGTRDDGQADAEHQHPAGLAQAEVRLHYGHSSQPEEDGDNDDQPEGFHERLATMNTPTDRNVWGMPVGVQDTDQGRPPVSCCEDWIFTTP